MKALGDQCWVNTAINFGTCCKWRLNDVDDDILCLTWQEFKRDRNYYVKNMYNRRMKYLTAQKSIYNKSNVH